MFRAVVQVRRRPSILDPQGKAVIHALSNLGFDNITEARIGKLVELSIDVADIDEAGRIAADACDKLLANPVMEDYQIDVKALEPVT